MYGKRKCDKCCALLSSKSSLKRHMEMHAENSETGFESKGCAGSFFKSTYHRNHHDCKYHFESLKLTLDSDNDNRNISSFSQGIKCPKCNLTVSTQVHLSMHMKIHEDDKPLKKCKICGGEFKESSFNFHKCTKKDKKGLLNCKDCSFNAKNASQLRTHSFTHTGYSEGKFQCDLEDCKAKFPSSGHLKMHSIMHHGKERGFKCSFCGYKCPHQKSLANHVKIHKPDEKRNLKCNFCQSYFDRTAARAMHESRFHGVAKVMYSCEIQNCNYRTKLKASMDPHRNMHKRKDGKYKCDECGARLSSVLHLNTHKKSSH